MNHSVKVEGFSKRYQIGLTYGSVNLREAIVSFVRRPFRRQDDEKGSIWALRDVSFEVNEGEVVGILGRNGAGKSTLLKLLSKITYPTSGRMKVNGRVAALLEVGTGFHEELTGRENIYLNGAILGMRKKEIKSKFDAIVDFADIEKFIDTPIKRYSSGMRLRLGFAVAAHLNAEILFVDEVLAVGDVGFQKKCLKSMSEMRNSGRTVLFVSHNMAAIENICPRAIWIDGGQIRKDGNAKDIIKEYMSTFVEAQKAGADLSQIEHRGGNGEVRFTGIEFLDTKREPLKLIRSGDDLIVRLYYHADKQISKSVVFGFRIYTELGTLITDLSTVNTKTSIPGLASGGGYIEAEIGFLNLMPGRYPMSLWLYSHGPILYDVLEYSVMLEVSVSDFYDSGIGIDSRNGIMFLPYKWNLSGLDNGIDPSTSAIED